MYNYCGSTTDKSKQYFVINPDTAKIVLIKNLVPDKSLTQFKVGHRSQFEKIYLLHECLLDFIKLLTTRIKVANNSNKSPIDFSY
jgi:hypothetical protein